MGEQDSKATSAPAGWYAHPSMADTQRYWDGSAWTDHVAPGLPPQVRQTSEHQAGQTLTFVALVLAFVLPIAGFAAGVVLLAKREAKAGAVVMVLSFVMAWVWLDLIAN